MCSFPSANVTLTKREHFLMVGQPYKIVLELEMPESPANQNLGMFMVCTKLKNREQDLVAKSCRSAMIQYKSALLHAINTFALSPFLLSGSSEEKQKVTVELFSNFQEDRVSLYNIYSTFHGGVELDLSNLKHLRKRTCTYIFHLSLHCL